MLKEESSYVLSYSDFWGKPYRFEFSGPEECNKMMVYLARGLRDSCRGHPLMYYENNGLDPIGLALVNDPHESKFRFMDHFMTRAILLRDFVHVAVITEQRLPDMGTGQARVIANVLEDFQEWIDHKCKPLLGDAVSEVEFCYENWAGYNEAFLALWNNKDEK